MNNTNSSGNGEYGPFTVAPEISGNELEYMRREQLAYNLLVNKMLLLYRTRLFLSSVRMLASLIGMVWSLYSAIFVDNRYLVLFSFFLVIYNLAAMVAPMTDDEHLVIVFGTESPLQFRGKK